MDYLHLQESTWDKKSEDREYLEQGIFCSCPWFIWPLPLDLTICSEYLFQKNDE